MAICPECDYDELSTDDLEEGEEMTCPECGQLLVVTGNDELQVADEDDEALDDDDEDEDEEGDDEDEVLDDDEEEALDD